MNRNTLTAMADHTLLKLEVTKAQIQALIDEAAELGTCSICVSPNQVPLQVLAGLKLCVVCGFPSGAYATEARAIEACLAVVVGVDEVDMVVSLSWVKNGRWEGTQADIAAVKAQALSPKLLKVIIELAALTDDEIVKCCQATQAAGADFVKTSTGFHPAGGVSAHAVVLIRKMVGDLMGVKVSGGIHIGEQALEMVTAGATRLGLSGTCEVFDILQGLRL